MTSRTKSVPKAIFAAPSSNESVRIRKIENGFIVTKTNVNRRGMYEEKEHFSATNPLQPPPAKRPG